jgi:hypothetical protein
MQPGTVPVHPISIIGLPGALQCRRARVRSAAANSLIAFPA